MATLTPIIIEKEIVVKQKVADGINLKLSLAEAILIRALLGKCETIYHEGKDISYDLYKLLDSKLNLWNNYANIFTDESRCSRLQHGDSEKNLEKLIKAISLDLE